MDSDNKSNLGTFVTHFICPRCQQYCIRAANSSDYQHDCFGSEVLSNEDVLVIGDWEDYTGSDVNINSTVTTLAGTENTLQGTRGQLEGGRNFPRTSRGFNRNTYRTRKHIEHIPDSVFSAQNTSDSEPVISDKE